MRGFVGCYSCLGVARHARARDTPKILPFPSLGTIPLAGLLSISCTALCLKIARGLVRPGDNKRL